MDGIYLIAIGRIGVPVRVPGDRAIEAGVVRMTTNAFLQLAFYIVVLVALVKPLGTFMARVYENKPVRTGQDSGAARAAHLSAVRRRSDRRDVVDALRLCGVGRSTSWAC